MIFTPKKAVLIATLGGLAISMSACSQAPETAQGEMTAPPTETSALPPEVYLAVIKNPAGERIGTAEISDNGTQGVKMIVRATNIPEGPHGMHFHVTADCTAPDFKSAGGHINPMGRAHGLENPQGPDNADMPNAVADANDTLNFEVVNERVSLNGDHGLPALLDADGSALVIHADPDDQMSQPIGGAGARIACAEIKK